MQTNLEEVSERRANELLDEQIDRRLDLLLANYQRVTADPRKMGYLRFLLRHYAKSPKPWTECFTPDTPVDCPRDHEKYPDGVPISKLKKGDLVWSFNSDLHIFELKEVKWSECIRKNAQLCRLTLDSGKTIRATKDHKFMMRDGAWLQLQDLRPGESLMPFFPGISHSFNHKVVSVDILDEYSDVWDIEVSDNHSFVVCGVVVHNCYKDNLKRFGPDKAKAVCGVLKDVIRQNTGWRHGKNGNSKVPDVGAPGVVIGEADASAAKGKHLADEVANFGPMDSDCAMILEELGNECDVFRVLIGLDDPPIFDKKVEL